MPSSSSLNRSSLNLLAGAVALALAPAVFAGQAPGAAAAPDIPVSHRDRIYAAEQFSNTVSVTDPVDNKLLGVIRLGDPTPGNFSPLYKGQVLVHGMGFAPDHRTLDGVGLRVDEGDRIRADGHHRQRAMVGRETHAMHQHLALVQRAEVAGRRVAQIGRAHV